MPGELESSKTSINHEVTAHLNDQGIDSILKRDFSKACHFFRQVLCSMTTEQPSSNIPRRLNEISFRTNHFENSDHPINPVSSFFVSLSSQRPGQEANL